MNQTSRGGLGCFISGFETIRRPELRFYRWLPPIAGLLILGPGIWGALTAISDLTEGAMEWLPSWLQFLRYVLVPVLWAIFLVGLGWVTLLLTAIICGPFLSALATRIEHLENPATTLPEVGLAAGIAATVRRELTKMFWYLPRALALAIAALIPGVAVLAAPLAWLFGAWVLAVQFADLTYENHSDSFQLTRESLWAERWRTLGFALPASFVMGIPFINLLLLPAIATGATLLALEIRRTEP